MAPHLRALYGDVRAVTGAENFIEAGDILTTETEILVGRSARTNAGGVAELAGIVADWGYRLREVFTPPGVVWHFFLKNGLCVLKFDSPPLCMAGSKVTD